MEKTDLISDFVSVRGIQLHYYRTGNRSGIPMVLVHGITDDGLCWMPVAKVLAPFYDIIMVDVRGHGKSDAPNEGYTLENLASDLASCIQSLQLKKPILLGHSLGAIISLLLAGYYPEIPRYMRTIPAGPMRNLGHGRIPNIDSAWLSPASSPYKISERSIFRRSLGGYRARR
jgi:pimeloyl-ACP methyl ester carboxylesterase